LPGNVGHIKGEYISIVFGSNMFLGVPENRK
jgi:hypothetical protein